MKEYTPAIEELDPIPISINTYITKICSSVPNIFLLETSDGDFINFNDLPEEVQNKIKEQVLEVLI